MNLNQIGLIEKKLLTMKDVINNNITNINHNKNKIDGPITQNLDDQSILIVNNDVIDELDRLERQELIKIDNALMKIQNGTYGRCIDCGNQIEKKRIKALPYALVCIDCANNR
jgi:DnaK suppressor protein